MILYPTETLYALGVNALDERELNILFELKERDADKAVSWLVRDIEDIKKYADFPESALKIATHFLPGKITLILKARLTVSDGVVGPDRTIGFRISSDEKAKELIGKFMNDHGAPLTCTSANVSGSPTLQTPSEILQQFGKNASMIDAIIDDGPRKSLASTIVRVVGEDVTVLREGEISEDRIKQALR